MNNNKSTNDTILQAREIYRGFDTPRGRVEVLKGVNLKVTAGEVVAILGVSGVGKTTLLHILGGLDRPDLGDVLFRETAYQKLSEAQLALFRQQHLGFVFQSHYLMAEFTARENVMMPLLIASHSRKESADRAELMLEEVGLKDRMEHRPGQLSGGEKQRVALARALVSDPDLVVADEPSGNLDSVTGEKLHRLLIDLSRSKNKAFVIATHNAQLSSMADRIIRLDEGINVAA